MTPAEERGSEEIGRVATLVELVARRASLHPDGTALTWRDRPLSWGELWREIRRFAARLAHRGIRPRDRVVIDLPNGLEFFTAFYGTLTAGAIAVPVYPTSSVRRVADLIGLCGARALTATRALDPASVGCEVLQVNDGEDRVEPFTGPPAIRPSAIAYIQYTSGSTGDPKGVMTSHTGLMRNIRQLVGGLRIEERDVFVTWLPVHHDMGLVLMTMVPFYLGARLFVLPTDLRRPLDWAEAIERRRATFTAAPDFAYRVLLRRLAEAPRVDLSSLRVALNAAEPVRERTVRDFDRTAGTAGVMLPAYGLAEATVGVSSATPGAPLVVDERGNVAVGRGFPGVELGILAENGPAPTGEIGEIVVASGANTPGYYRNPAATRQLLAGGGWIRTGDLGYRDADGELFVVARKKNIIIHAGRNLSPREIEECVDPLPGVRFSSAVGIDRGDDAGEQIYCFAEVRRDRSAAPDSLRALSIEIVRAIHHRLGIRPARVTLLAPHAIPLTANGKVRHAALRASYLEGDLRERGAILYPPP